MKALRDAKATLADTVAMTHTADRLKTALRELVDAIEAAPAASITECNQIPGAADFDYGEMTAAVLKFHIGARVALVVIE